MVSNSDLVIICGIGCFGLGTLSYYAWKHSILSILKARKYRKRVQQIEDGSQLCSPDNIEEIFKGMDNDQKKAGRELLVMGYAVSFKNWMMLDQGLLKISPKMTNYLTGFPQELVVVNKFYPHGGSGAFYEELKLRELYGYKFAIEHKGGKYIFIEPFLKTELIGFPEFYHKKRVGFMEKFWDSIGSITSTDPFIMHNYSSSILFEGDYITAFGVVSYQISNDSFTMTKPLAIVRGGVDALKEYFRTKQYEKTGKGVVLAYVAIILTACTVGCYFLGKYFYDRIEARRAAVAAKFTELEDMMCISCKRSKRDVIFEPCLHLLYCNSCCENNDSPLDKRKLEKCEMCGENVAQRKRIFIP